MSSPLVVIDTNVFIAGLLSASGAPAKIVDSFFQAELIVLVDFRILEEYQRVFYYPRLNIEKILVARLLAAIDKLALHVVCRPLIVSLPDASDLPFIEVAVSGNADALITGNLKHFPGVPQAMSPRSFVDSEIFQNR
jgi:putative PIN family toxin of toxin-antitoxin system